MKTKENVKKSNLTKLTRNGISLIVLVITIIVIIILAAAIIISLNNNNPIMEANKARYDSDVANMQAVFTNAVAKVMAKNQATLTISAGQINTITGGVKETDGQVAYKLIDAQNVANATGTIIFDKGTNTDTVFYTGKKLPIYPAGNTKWYVDEEGKISLEIADNKYGNGIIVKLFLVSGSEFNALIPSNTTSITFTDEVAPSGVELIDVSQKQDQGIVAWFEDTNMKVSSQKAGAKIIANPDCSNMFANCKNVTSMNLANLDTCEATNMSGMFTYCANLTSLDLNHFNTSKVTNMSSMFKGAFDVKTSTLDIKNFDTSNVTDMSYMFAYCNWLETVDVSGFNTSNVTNMSYMFDGLNDLKELNVSGFDTSNVTNMQNMFYYCKSVNVIDVSNFNTSNVTDMSRMFSNCRSITSLDLSNFNTEKVEYMSWMFSCCIKLYSLDLTSFNTSKVRDMYGMFSGYNPSPYYEYLTMSLSYLDLSSFDTSKVQYFNYMFQECRSLYKCYSGSKEATVDFNNAMASAGLNARFLSKDSSSTLVSGGAFGSKIPSDITSIVLGVDIPYNNQVLIDLSSEGDWGVVGFTSYSTFYISTRRPEVKVQFNENCTAMFGKANLTQISFVNVDTSKVKNMTAMFNNATGLTSLDLSSFDTSLVTDMTSMFTGCSNLKTLNISNWNTSNVTYMMSMFNNCSSLTSLDLSSWSINDAANLSSMFSGCTAITDGQALAKTQADADKLNASSQKPTTWNFIVK